MIQFNCASCGKAFTVPDAAAGRTGKCNKCGHRNQVPAPAASRTRKATPAPVAEVEPSPAPFRPVAPPSNLPALQPFQSLDQPAGNQTVVIVQQPRRSSNSLAVASIIIAVLAFVFCWIPFLGIISIPVSLLALLLGILGLIICVFRRGSGLGFSAAGVVLSLLSLIISVSMAMAITKSVAVLGRDLDNQATQRQATNQQVVKPTSPPLVPAAILDAEAPRAPTVETAPQKPPLDPKDEWANAENAVQQGNVRIKINSVKIDFASVKSFEGTNNSKEKLLLVELTIDNVSDSKKLDFRGFAGKDFDFGGDSKATLEDNIGNHYRAVTFGFSSPIVGQVASESVYPGKSINDLLVFEVPVDKIEYLRLELPATPFGGKGKLRIEIPRSLIQW